MEITVMLLFLMILLLSILIIFGRKERVNYSIKTFEKELNLIKDKNLLNLLEEVFKKVPKEFWTMPASTTGKYHPIYALGKGGLVRHTKAAIKIAESLLNLEMYNDLNKDLIIASLILHDSVKPGFTKEGKALDTQSLHPIFASNLLEETLKEFEKNLDDFEKEKLKEQVKSIQRMVKSHMGQWNKNKEGKIILPKPEKDDEKFVHLCYYLASRKFLEIPEELLMESK